MQNTTDPSDNTSEHKKVRPSRKRNKKEFPDLSTLFIFETSDVADNTEIQVLEPTSLENHNNQILEPKSVKNQKEISNIKVSESKTVLRPTNLEHQNKLRDHLIREIDKANRCNNKNLPKIIKIIKILDLQTQDTIGNQKIGDATFLWSIKNGYKQICKFLITKYPHVIYAVDKENMNPLMLAAKVGHTEIYNILKQNFHFPNKNDEETARNLLREYYMQTDVGSISLAPENIRAYNVPTTSTVTSKQTTITKLNSFDYIDKDSANAYTHHAKVRSKQREISSTAVKSTLEKGTKFSNNKGTSTYIDEDRQVILSKSNAIITLNENKRNTSFNLLNYTKAKEERLKAKVAQNNDSAMCDLADLYLSGQLGKQDVIKAHELFLRAAKAKNSHAMSKLAGLYKSDLLGNKNEKEAKKWLEKAALYGNKFALTSLGEILIQEYSVSCDELSEREKNKLLKKITNLLENAIAKGDAKAMSLLAGVYKAEWLGEKKLDKAIELYVNAAKLGNPYALQNLYNMAISKEFPQDDFEKILDSASNLISKIDSRLALEIGLSIIQGNLGNNTKRGFSLLESAAKKGNEAAIIYLAKFYRDGKGCAPDQKLSLYWFNQLELLYKQVANKGNPEACWKLAKLYLKGRLGKIDLVKAEQYFIYSAKEDDADAAYSLGMFYIQGKLGIKNPKEGVKWIKKSIELWSKEALQGDSKAALKIADIYLCGDMGQKDYSKALEWLTLGAEQNNKQALIYLAKFHLSNRTGYKNVTLAASWIDKILSQEKSYLSFHLSKDIKELIQKLALKENIKEASDWLIQKTLENNKNIEELLNKKEQGCELTKIQSIILWHLSESLIKGESKFLTYPQAAQVYSMYAQDRSTEACIRLIEMYRNNQIQEISNSTRKDLDKNLQLVNLKTNSIKNSDHALMVGKCYQEGIILPKSLTPAVQWFYLATRVSKCEDDYLRATQEFEVLLQYDYWNDKEKQEILSGMRILIKSAERNDYKDELKVLYRIGGDISNDGKLTSYDPKGAIKFYEKAAALGNSRAMYKLGVIYENGALGNTDFEKAVDWYIKSAKVKNQDALQALAKLYNLHELEYELKIQISLQLEGTTLQINNPNYKEQPLPNKITMNKLSNNNCFIETSELDIDISLLIGDLTNEITDCV